MTSNKNAKQILKCTFEDLDECLTAWFEQCREQRIPVSGVMLQEATEFAKKLGYDNFKASNGWLESFKCRKGIVFRKICGKSAAVPQNVCYKWVEDELPSLTKIFDPVGTFNADETGLFYQCLPNKTAVLNGEKCRGGKKSKIRVMVVLGANQDGSEKLPPLMIGRSAKPRCFKGVKSFPIAYESNRKVWMTSELFGQWIKKIHRSMGSK